MKKIFALILTILFVIPFTVYADTKPAVKTLETTVEGSKISFEGTMENGSTAVMCKLYDSKDSELDLLSTSVSSNKFEGEFEVDATGDYVVSCANYDGGTIKTAEATIEDTSTKEYTVEDEDGNEIIFTEQKGHTYTLSMIDILKLTDEELAAMDISKEDFEAGYNALKESAKDLGEVIAVFEIQLFDEDDNEVHEGPFTIRIKLTDDMKKYDAFKLTFIGDNNKLENPIDLKIDGEYLVGAIDHLSTYVLTGTVTDTTPKTNPKTGDLTFVWIGALVVSVIALGIVLIVSKRNKKNK